MTRGVYASGLGPLGRTLWAVAALSALVNLLMLTGPLFMLQLYDRVLASGSVATLQGLFLIVIGAYAFLGLYDFLRARLMSRASYRLDQALGGHAFERWVRASLAPAPLEGRPLGDLATLRGFLASPAALGLFDLPWIPFYLAIVWLIHPWLGQLALGGALVVFAAALLNQWLTHRHFARAMSLDAREAGFVEQSHRTAEALLPMGMLGPVARHWQAMHAGGLATGQQGGDRAEGLAAFSKAFRLLLQSALLALGGYLALRAEISPGMIVAASIIAGRALAPVDQVIGQWRLVVRAREAHRRLGAVLKAPPAAAPMALPEPAGHLEVRGLAKLAPGLAGRGDRPPLLRDIAFTLAPGDGLGVIGPSASGKTTLARCLIGAWAPDAGEVRLDGATLAQWPADQLGRHVGYLPQSLELLAGSVRDNIARFDPDATPEEVVAAARVAGVHEMILALPDGYDTAIGATSAPLSGGQLQRVGLARAVFRLPRLVVLDEPNANLDMNGDEALSAAIKTLREAGSVVVVMAHRPSAIAAVNKLMVLNAGTVADVGDKASVLRGATRAAAPAPAAPAGQSDKETGVVQTA